MYQKFYDEIAEETSDKIRQNEMRAFSHSIHLLEKAKSAGNGTKESVEALFFLGRLWGVLLEDLASSGNGLPEQLRAQLISIGIWVLKHAESLRQGLRDDFQPIIDVTRSIYEGLKVQKC